MHLDKGYFYLKQKNFNSKFLQDYWYTDRQHVESRTRIACRLIIIKFIFAYVVLT